MFTLLLAIILLVTGYYLSKIVFGDIEISEFDIKDYYENLDTYRKKFTGAYVLVIIFNLISIFALTAAFAFVLFQLWIITFSTGDENIYSFFASWLIPGLLFGLSFSLYASFGILKMLFKEKYKSFLVHYNNLYRYDATSSIRMISTVTLVLGVLATLLVSTGVFK